jgi:Fe-S-cluster containining protein
MKKPPGHKPESARRGGERDPGSNPPGSEFDSFDLALRIGRERVRIRARVPRGPVSLPEFLPVVQALTDAVMAAVARGVEREGRPISCGPGCGACCRQLVPIGEAEAVHLQDVLKAMSGDRRDRILQRFSAAAQTLTESGLLDALTAASGARSRDERREIGLRYFRLGIPCPFLEEESCGIHPHRPLACREYVVTSDPRHCGSLESGRVEMVELPHRPSAVFYRFGDGKGAAPARWLALPLALEPVRAGRVEAPSQTFDATELFTRFLQRLVRTRAEEEGVPGTGQG